MGNAVFVAFFFAFLFFGGFTFATSSGTVVSAVAAVDVFDALFLFIDAVDVPAMALFGGRLLIITDFVFVFVFFFCLGFIDAIGSSSDVESVDPCILIKRSMFLPCVDRQGHILQAGQYLQRWWFMVDYKYSVVSGFGCA